MNPRPLFILLITAAAASAASAQSEKQKLWENAANYASDRQRCNSLLVFPKHESTCNSQQSVVSKCGDAGSFKCGSVYSQAQQSIACIRTSNSNRKELLDRRSAIESRLSSLQDAERKNAEDELKTIGDQMNQADRMTRECEVKVEGERREMRLLFDLAKSCVTARKAVYDAFGDAIEAAERDSDESIWKVRNQVVAEWKASRSGHENILRNWQAATDHCERLNNSLPSN